MSKKNTMSIILFVLVFVTPTLVQAGVTVYEKGDAYLKLGAVFQLQYYRANPEYGEQTDSMRLRRITPYIEGSRHKDWKLIVEWEMGSITGDNEIAVLDNKIEYTGFNNMKVTIGNRDAYFSRELLTSTNEQQMVERSFVGDSAYGTPDKSLGLHVEGTLKGQLLHYGVSLTSSLVEPHERKLAFNTPINREVDFNEGYLIAGRIEYQPMGPIAMSQSDFTGAKLLSIGVGGYKWTNDGDNNTHTTYGIDDGVGSPDIDNVNGLELSGVVRGKGFSLDFQRNQFNAETVVTDYTGGLYKNGKASMHNYAFEGGYMIKEKQLEIIASYQVQDSDTYAEDWTRTSFGLIYYHMANYDMKAQLTYRQGSALGGVKGDDEDELFLQFQYLL